MKKLRKRELEQKKRELKEDPFIQFVGKAWEMATSVKTYIAIAAVVVLTVVIVSGMKADSKKTAQDQGWAALAELEAAILEMPGATEEEREAQVEAGLEGLAKMVSKTQRSSAQPVIVFRLATGILKKGGKDNAEKAEAHCRFFLEKFPENYYALSVKLLLGKALLEQEKHESALEAFQDTYDVFLAGTPTALKAIKYEACYYVGRCHELLSRPVEARNMYELLSSQADESPLWADMAQFRLSKMES
ncbi:MAG: hypothetical protein HQ592_03555 [Planctomycetes bacterium]|nr:hypothetical protein [Planctomycetota bacterium]